jgi:hypothetical protein
MSRWSYHFIEKDRPWISASQKRPGDNSARARSSLSIRSYSSIPAIPQDGSAPCRRASAPSVRTRHAIDARGFGTSPLIIGPQDSQRIRLKSAKIRGWENGHLSSRRFRTHGLRQREEDAESAPIIACPAFLASSSTPKVAHTSKQGRRRLPSHRSQEVVRWSGNRYTIR